MGTNHGNILDTPHANAAQAALARPMRDVRDEERGGGGEGRAGREWTEEAAMFPLFEPLGAVVLLPHVSVVVGLA